MWMFNQDSPPHTRELADDPPCYRCNAGDISPLDVFGSHCADCLIGMAAEVEVDFGEIGDVQALLANHRAFADWLRTQPARRAA